MMLIKQNKIICELYKKIFVIEFKCGKLSPKNVVK